MNFKISNMLPLFFAVALIFLLLPLASANDTLEAETDSNFMSSDIGEDIKTDGQYDYETIPSPSNVNYTKGESEVISVEAKYSPASKEAISGYSMYVYINGEDIGNRVKIDGVDSSATNFDFNLNLISDKLVDGQNTLTFHPNKGLLQGLGYMDTLNFNPLTVNVGNFTPADNSIYVSTEGDNDNPGTKEKPLRDITNAIKLANSTNVTQIYIMAGNYKECDIEIFSGISISGIGKVVIDAEKLGRIFKITTSANVFLSNLTLANGLAPKDIKDSYSGNFYSLGGAIYIKNAKVVMDNMIFVNNTAANYGGAVDWEGNNGVITNSRFINNSATNVGGAVDWEGSNGMVIDCYFENNRANRGGAIDWEGDTATVVNSTFLRNYANQGAGIFMLNTLKSKGNNISNNIFAKNIAPQRGGAIDIENENQNTYSKVTVIENNEFISNEAEYGGAIVSYYGAADVINNKFSGNLANWGSAIFNNGISSLKNNTIINKKDLAIYNLGKIKCDFVLTFMEGKTIAVNDGKGVTLNVSVVDDVGNPISGGYVTFKVDGTATLNTAYELVDGFTSVRFVPRVNGTLTVSGVYENSQLKNSDTKINGTLEVSNAIADYNGIIYVSDKNGDDDNTGSKDSPVKTFDQAYLLATRAGGLHTIVLESGHYYASGYTLEDSITIIGSENTILDGENKATIFSLYGLEDTVFKFINITFINGYASKSLYGGSYTGGAIFFKGGHLYLENDVFINNTADDYGGAIYVNKGLDLITYKTYLANATIVNCTFKNNTVPTDQGTYCSGGAISNYGGNITIIDSTFDENKASAGGAIAIVQSSGNMTVINSVFNNNFAGKIAGAAYVNAIKTGGVNYTVSFTDCIFKNNSALDAAAVDISNGVINGCTFIENNATRNAGAVMTVGNVVIKNNRFVNNTAEEFAGAILITQSTSSWNPVTYEITLKNNTISGCHAKIADEIYTYSNVNIHGLTLVFLSNETLKYILDSDVTLVANVFDDMGNLVSGNDFTFEIGDENYTTYVNNGIATLNLQLAEKYNNTVVTGSFKAGADDAVIKTGKLIVVPYYIVIGMNNVSGEVGEKVNVNITVTNSIGEYIAGGNVSVSFNNEKFSVPIINGTAKFNITLPNIPGKYNLTVSYENASVTKIVTVNSNREVNLTVGDVEKYFGGFEKLIATLRDSYGNPIANATVYFTVNGQTYAKSTDTNGTASIGLNLVSNVYDVSVSYNGSDKYDAVSKNVTVTINPTIVADNLVKMYQNATRFYAKFTDSTGKALANTEVKFNIHGVFYTKKTDKDGVADLGIMLRPGSYILTAYNPVTGEEKGFNITVKSLIMQNDLTKYYLNASKFEATVYNKDGSLAVNKNVTFNINGVFYTKTTDKNGVASLGIALRPGNYTITTMYDGLDIGNRVSVLPTLVTKDLSMKYLDGTNFTALTLDGQGKPLANQNVSFNVNGVFYHKTTDENGIANLNIRLNPGKYIITSIWNEYQVGNNITIA